MEKYEAIAWLAKIVDRDGSKDETNYKITMLAAEYITQTIYKNGAEINLKNGTK